jgi:hypothetical protein
MNANLTLELFDLVGHGISLEQALDLHDLLSETRASYEGAIDAARSVVESVRRIEPAKRIEFARRPEVSDAIERERRILASAATAERDAKSIGLHATANSIRELAESIRAIGSMRDAALRGEA